MKILQINAVYGFGSTGRNVRELHRHLHRKGHESWVGYAIDPKGKADKNDGKIFKIGNVFDRKMHALLSRIFHNQGCWSRRVTARLCKKIDRLGPDIVHLNNLHSNFIHLPLLLNYLSERETAVVITLHDCWFFTGGCHYYTKENCERWISGCTGCRRYPSASHRLSEKERRFREIKKLGVIGVSDWITGEAKKTFLGTANRITRIYNWVDPEIFHILSDRNGVKRELHFPADKKIVLGVAQRWSEQKGLAEMLHIAKSIDDCIVVLAGEKPPGRKMPENVLRYGFIQNSEELVKLYNAADVLVNPSRMEAFGKVTAEALACGTPVVLYRNTGSAELVEEAVGAMAENLNLAELTEKTREILQKEKSHYAQACREAARKKFDMEQRLQDYVQVYESLLAGEEG